MIGTCRAASVIPAERPTSASTTSPDQNPTSHQFYTRPPANAAGPHGPHGPHAHGPHDTESLVANARKSPTPGKKGSGAATAAILEPIGSSDHGKANSVSARLDALIHVGADSLGDLSAIFCGETQGGCLC